MSQFGKDFLYKLYNIKFPDRVRFLSIDIYLVLIRQELCLINRYFKLGSEHRLKNEHLYSFKSHCNSFELIEGLPPFINGKT
jgi:hypothetical protein